MQADRSILWRRLDIAAHEYARVHHDESSWTLSGTALLAHDAQPCRIDYVVTCDESWSTRAARASGWVGERSVDVSITADGGAWTMNGVPCAAVEGCIDVDLNFSPSTNLLPIRRLNLAIGSRAEVRAAWLRFPGFTLERLEQVYTRLAERTYRYESAGGRFVAEIEVDDIGLPVKYGDLWASDSPRR
jgi:hypothetical protein